MYFLLIIACFLGSLICNDVEDALAHDYENTIFYCGDDCFWEPSNKEESLYAWWVPKWYYDGWHFVKTIRQWLIYVNIPWLVMLMLGFRFCKDGKLWYFKYHCQLARTITVNHTGIRPLYWYLIFMLLVEVVIYIMHATFYSTIFVS
jgi:hypothetical protein